MKAKATVKIKIVLAERAAKALDKIRGSQTREEYLTAWIAAHWDRK